MDAKEQNINLWDFSDIAMSIAYIVAVMFLFVGVSKLLLFDMKGVVYSISVQVILYLISSVSVLFVVITKRQNSFADFFGSQNFLFKICAGMIVFGLIIFATSFIDIAFEYFMHVKSTDVYKNIDIQKLKTISFVGVLFAPFAEEVFFRGFLQPVFIKKFGFWLGIIIVTLIFSLLHILYVSNISALFCILSVGLILSLAKEKTNSLIPCIVAHFLNNLAAVFYLYF